MKSTVDGVDSEVDFPMYLTVVLKDPPETPSAPPTEKSPLCCADTVTPNAIAAIKMIIFFMLISFVVKFGAKLRQFQMLSKEIGSNSLIL